MLPNLFASLDRLPRVGLAHLPTPIEPLPNLSAHLGGPELYIKRDDQTGLATGGNKARKLEFLIAQALEVKADVVITSGGAQSNHARQTAAAAARFGLGCHLILTGPQPERLSGNLLLDHLLGARVHWIGNRAENQDTVAQLEADLSAAGKRPFVIPFGGSDARGLLGYAVAMREFVAQARGLPRFDAHVFATGSGGTQAGMILGAYLARMFDEPYLLGISVDRSAETLAPRVAQLVNSASAFLDVDWRISASDVAINNDYRGAGYAILGDPEREAIRLMARHEGILVDPVYTGRALAGLIDLIRLGAFTVGQRVLFWHTGGTAGLYAFGDNLGF